jgi:hypothetical protein
METTLFLWVPEKNQKNSFAKQKLCIKFAPA